MAEAYFGEGAKHRKYSKASHTSSGRRRKVASAEGEGFWDDFKRGFKSTFDPIGKPLLGLLPGGNIARAGLEAVGLGRPHRRALHSRLSHHELGFQGMGDGDLEDLDYFGGGCPSRSGGGKGMMRLTSRPAYVGAEGDAHTGFKSVFDPIGKPRLGLLPGEGANKFFKASHTSSGGVRHRRRAGEGDAHYAMGDAHTGGRRKRKPSARNLLVRKVMMERGCSLPEASSIVKREGLF